MSSGVVLDIVLAVFAVFGLYTVVRLIIATFFHAGVCRVAVSFLTPDDAQNAAYLIACAREQVFLPGAARVTALVSPALAGDRALLALLCEEEISYYIVEGDGKGA